MSEINAPVRFRDYATRDFKLFVLTRFIALLCHQMLILGVSQFVYELTKDPLYLGYVGLAIFVPKFLFTLFGGQAADLYDRRAIMVVCRIIQFFATIGLALIATSTTPSLNLIYVLLFLLGATNAFDAPATSALLPRLVEAKYLTKAITWSSASVQFAVIFGPTLGGAIYGLTGQAFHVFVLAAALRVVGAITAYMLEIRTGRAEKANLSVETLLAGLRFVFQTRIILAAISLDLFAVLLGGAVALLPIYANEILHVGPRGLGVLRGAPAFGAAIMAILLANRPPFRRAGQTMLTCVAIFGVATIVFGYSTSPGISFLALFVLGAADMVSMVIRGTLVQLNTPDEMRGRVSAVNLIFIGASNELGEFESGVTARYCGTVEAVALGGLGTLVVVFMWTLLFPEIRRLKELTK